MKYILFFALLLINYTVAAQATTTSVPKEIIQAGDKTVAVYDYEGLHPILNLKNDTTYIINFWATWCVPCVQELPFFEALLEKYKTDKLSIKLVSLDFKKQVDRSLIPFLKKKGLKADIILLDDSDANSWIDRVDPSWSGALPATLILNSKQRLFFEKSFTFDELETEYLKTKK